MLRLVATILLAVTIVAGQDQEVEGINAADAVGTLYTIMFTENDARRPDFTFNVSIFLTTHEENEVSVVVSVPLASDTFPTQRAAVRKGEVTEITFHQNLMHVGSGISNKGVKILASGDIVVYGVNPQRFSSEGFISIPDRLLGEEYFAVAMPPETSYAQIGVVAVKPGNTVVEVTLPNDAGLSIFFNGRIYRSGETIQATLGQYRTLQLQHSSENSETADLSGAFIKCSQFCSCFSGNARTSVNGKSRDLLVEQLPPLATWGRAFAVPTTPERTDRDDILKIVCQQDGTSVSIDGESQTCSRGGRIQLEINTTSPHWVIATKPIMCATVVQSQQGSDAIVKADPAMTLIIPEEQYASTYTVATARWSGADGAEYTNYLTIVIRRSRVDSIILDGENVNTAFPSTVYKVVEGTGSVDPLVTAYFQISSGTHTITTLSRDIEFMCIVYGAGDRETYAYMGGMRLAIINPPCTQSIPSPGDGKDNDCDARSDEELCDAEDDDNDGAVDEDCRIANAVIAQGDQNVFRGEDATLRWRVYAVNKDFSNVILRKQQPGQAWVQFASGQSGSITIDEPFLGEGVYSLSMSAWRKSGELWISDVQLSVSESRFKDTGNYSLSYSGHDSEIYQDENYLNVRPVRQIYEITAVDAAGSSQSVKSDQTGTRQFFLTEGQLYTMRFSSIGGQHNEDLPYRVFFDDRDVTSNFEVVGERPDVSGAPTGLQDVRAAYQLVYTGMEASLDLNGVTVSVRNNANVERVDVDLNVESITRPSISCQAQLVEGDSGQAEVVCQMTDMTSDIRESSWSIDGGEGFATSSTENTYGDYTVKYTNNGGGRYTAYIRGIRASQWPASGGVRTFRYSFKQRNDFSLSKETPIDITFIQPPQTPVLTGSEREQGGVYTLVATVSGGRPAPTSWYWTLPDGTTLRPGQQNDQYSASNGEMMNNGNMVYTLNLKNGKPLTRSSFQFTVSTNSGWQPQSVSYTVRRSVESATITSSHEVSPSGTATVTMIVRGGSPPANRLMWTFDYQGVARELRPGNSFGPYSASQGVSVSGGTSYTLTFNNLSDLPKDFTFRASYNSTGVGSWFATQTENVQPRVEIPQLTLVEDDSPNTYRLKAVLSGGSPAGNEFWWILSDGSRLDAGSSAGSYVASSSSTDSNGNLVFYLTFVNGFPNTRSTYEFNANSGNYWSVRRSLTVRSEVANQAATITSTSDIDSGVAFVTMRVSGGQPQATNYRWTFTDGGRTITLLPGETNGVYRADDGERQTDGSYIYKLYITDLLKYANDYTFRVESRDSNNIARWSASQTETVTSAINPTVDCSIDKGSIKVGDILTIECTVTPNGYRHDQLETEYTNQGNTYNTDNSNNQFNYQRSSPDGQVVQSKITFQIPANNEALRNWVHTLRYPGGTIRTEIELTIPEPIEPTAINVTAVEGQDFLSLRCVIEGSQVETSEVVWTRISYGAARLRKIVYLSNSVTDPSVSVETRTVSNGVESVLRIDNVDRTDAADYECSADNSRAIFSVDVIGSTFLIESNGVTKVFDSTTVLNANQRYNFIVEFESVRSRPYFIYHNGRDTTSSYSMTVSPSQRTYPASATGGATVNYDTTRYTFRYNNVSPAGLKYVQTLYGTSGQPQSISLYRIPVEGDTLPNNPRVINIQVQPIGGGPARNYSANEQFVVANGKLYSVIITIETDCNDDEYKIHLGNRDITRQFTSGRRPQGNKCIVTFESRTISPGPVDLPSGTPLRVIVEKPQEREVLTTNPINTSGPEPTPPTDVPPTPDPSDREDCGPNNCDRDCYKVNGADQCQCPPGFELSVNGWSCVDVNECANDPCDEGEECYETYGSYVCIKQCECDCCDQSGGERKKRSVELPEASQSSSTPLSAFALVGWLGAISTVSIVALIVSVIAICCGRRAVKQGA